MAGAIGALSIPEAVKVKDMVASQLLVAGSLSHLLTTDDADVVTPLQVFWCGIREALVHVGSNTPRQTDTRPISVSNEYCHLPD